MIDFTDLISDHLSLRAGKPGDIIFLGGRPLRRGEMLCDGREYQVARYPRLYAAIGRKWGVGNGTTTANIPDLRGVVLAGRTTMGIRGNRTTLRNSGGGAIGFDPTTVGKWGGGDRRTVDISNLPVGVLSRTAGFGTAIAGETTGTGGDPLRETTALTVPLSVVQPTAICDFAILLGQDEVIIPPVPEPNTGTSDFEFNGPFNDWLDVVNDFGAVGDGVADDSDAIEDMVHALAAVEPLIGSSGDYDTYYAPVAGFFPGGTIESPKVYLITRQIRLPNSDRGDTAGALGLRLFGADPRTTIIKWAGEPGENMLWMCGVHDGVIGRLTLDGSGTAVSGIRIERDPVNQSLNQSYNRIEDVFFKDMARGVENTQLIAGYGTDSEIDIMRCRFYRCSEFGVLTTAPEAYDYWVRSCYFEGCGVGVGRLIDPQYVDFTDSSPFDANNAGQFSVWDSVFNGSLLYDIDAVNGDNIGIRRNVSVNAHRFIRIVNGNITVEGNRIITPALTDCFQIITQYGNPPNAMIARNEFAMSEGASGPIIVHVYDAGLDPYRLAGDARNNDPRYMNYQTYYVGNKFSVAYSEVIALDPYFAGGRFLDSQFVSGSLLSQTISTTVGQICPVPPQVSRQVFYFTNTPVNGQSTIDAAVAYEASNPGSRPIVYLPYFADIGRRSTGEQTLVVPPGVRMSIQGGGSYATLSWGGDMTSRTTHDDQPVLWLQGPEVLVTLANFRIPSFGEGNKSGLHLVVDNCNEAGARFYAEGSLGMYNFLGTHKLDAWMVSHNIAPASEACIPMRIEGSDAEAATGRVVLEGGTGSIISSDPGAIPLFQVADGGRFWIREYWHETTEVGQIQFKLTGAAQPGWLSAESSRFRPGDEHGGATGKHWNAIRQITIDGWKGDMAFSVLNMVGRPTLLNSTADFRWVNLSSWCCAFDDGGYFYTYDGTPIKQIGTVGDGDADDYLSLPDWPSSYAGDDGDAYFTMNNEHLWVWKSGAWNDIGGIVITYATSSDLPSGYTGATLDCALILDTHHVWQWNGATWDELADGTTPLPATYWHCEGWNTGIADQSQNWGLHKEFDSPPVGFGGTQPVDWRTMLDTMWNPAPPKFVDSLAAGLSDVRFLRLQGSATFMPGTFVLP